MKPLKLIAFFLLNAFFCCYGFSADTDSINFSAPVYGTKIIFPVIKANLYDRGLESIVSGIEISSAGYIKNANLSVKAGNLSKSGGMSLLTSPALLKPATPFYNGTFIPKAILSSLPGNTSFNRPFGTYIYGSFNKKSEKKFQKGIFSFFADETGIYSGSFISQFNIKSFKMHLNFITGLFPYDENTFTSYYTKDTLYNTDLYFPEGQHFCSSLQISLQNKKFSTILTAGFFESPFDTIDDTLRLETKIALNKTQFIFSFSGIRLLGNINFNENNNIVNHFYILTANEHIIKTGIQIIAGIHKSFMLILRTPLLCKAGITASAEKQIFDNTSNIRICTGLQATGFFSRHIFTTTIDFKTSSETELEKLSFSLKNYFYMQKLTPAINLNFLIKQDNNLSEKISFSFITGKKINLKTGIECTLLQTKGDFLPPAFSASIETKISFTNLIITGKINASF